MVSSHSKSWRERTPHVRHWNDQRGINVLSRAPIRRPPLLQSCWQHKLWIPTWRTQMKRNRERKLFELLGYFEWKMSKKKVSFNFESISEQLILLIKVFLFPFRKKACKTRLILHHGHQVQISTSLGPLLWKWKAFKVSEGGLMGSHKPISRINRELN